MSAAQRNGPIGITAIAMIGVAATLLTPSPVHAVVSAQPAHSTFYPLEPPGQTSDPRSEVQELLRQTTDLHDSWDNLTPDQRNQRLTQLQQQATTVDRDIQNLPADQRAEVQAMLWQAVAQLAELVMKAQSPSQPCFFPLCLPGL